MEIKLVQTGVTRILNVKKGTGIASKIILQM